MLENHIHWELFWGKSDGQEELWQTQNSPANMSKCGSHGLQLVSPHWQPRRTNTDQTRASYGYRMGPNWDTLNPQGSWSRLKVSSSTSWLTHGSPWKPQTQFAGRQMGNRQRPDMLSGTMVGLYTCILIWL